MRYLRLFSVLLLSTLAITGCHHQREQAAPPPQAQAPPIVSTLPPVPPLTFPNVELAKPKPAAPPTQPVVAAAKPKKPPKKRIRHHHIEHKVEPDTVATTEQPDSTAPASGAAVLGQLSADDATANPHQDVQTKDLIEQTEDRLKKLSPEQKTTHKDAIAQVASFLTQAKQAWAMKDVVGAQTLANKAKILLDEMLK